MHLLRSTYSGGNRIKVKVQSEAKLTTGLDGSEMKLETKDTVPDGTIGPTCQQVCPSDGVVFGDLPDSDRSFAAY